MREVRRLRYKLANNVPSVQVRGISYRTCTVLILIKSSAGWRGFWKTLWGVLERNEPAYFEPKLSSILWVLSPEKPRAYLNCQPACFEPELYTYRILNPRLEPDSSLTKYWLEQALAFALFSKNPASGLWAFEPEPKARSTSREFWTSPELAANPPPSSSP